MVAARAVELRGTIAIDTAIYIYTFERHAAFAPYSNGVLHRVETGSLRAVSSTLVIAEAAVQPYRLGLGELARGYAERLEQFPNLELIAPRADICLAAADLRGRYRSLHLADALHLATALAADATAFLTHDTDLPPGLPIEVVQITDLTGDTGGER